MLSVYTNEIKKEFTNSLSFFSPILMASHQEVVQGKIHEMAYLAVKAWKVLDLIS